MLAEVATPGNSDLGLWIGCANFFLLLIGAAVYLVKTLRNDPEKRDVTISQDALTRREFEDARVARDKELQDLISALNRHIDVNRQEHEGLHKKLGGVERGARAELAESKKEEAESRRRLHQEITTLTSAISKLDGKIEGMN